MRRLIVIFVITFISISCATHNGTISSSSINQNVKYLDIAYGVTQINKYFGLGGLSQDAMVLEAKRELIKNRPLRQNETYSNFTLDFKNTYILFYCQTKVTMSADVIRFSNDTVSEPYSQHYKTVLNRNGYSNELFNIGDSIIDLNYNKGVILSFVNNKKVRISYKTTKDKFRTTKVLLKDIYVTNKSYKGYNVGDSYNYNINYYDARSSKIIGFGLNSLLLNDNSNFARAVNYKK